MEVNGMIRDRPVRLELIDGSVVALYDMKTQTELARADSGVDIEFDGHTLHIGGFSVRVDDSNLWDAKHLVSLLHSLSSGNRTSPGQVPYPDQPSEKPIRSACGGCGASLQTIVRYCPHCGVQQTGLGERADEHLGSNPGGDHANDVGGGGVLRSISTSRGFLLLVAAVAVIAVGFAAVQRERNQRDDIGAVQVESTTDLASTSPPQPSLALKFNDHGWTHEMKFYWGELGLLAKKNILNSPPGFARLEVLVPEITFDIENLDEAQGRLRPDRVEYKFSIAFDEEDPAFEYFPGCPDECYVGKTRWQSSSTPDSENNIDDGSCVLCPEQPVEMIDTYFEKIQQPPRYFIVEPDGTPGCSFIYDFKVKTWKVAEEYSGCAVL